MKQQSNILLLMSTYTNPWNFVDTKPKYIYGLYSFKCEKESNINFYSSQTGMNIYIYIYKSKI